MRIYEIIIDLNIAFTEKINKFEQQQQTTS